MSRIVPVTTTVVSTSDAINHQGDKVMMIVIMAIVVVILVIVLVWWIYVKDQPTPQPITPTPIAVPPSNGQTSSPSVPPNIPKVGLSDDCDDDSYSESTSACTRHSSSWSDTKHSSSSSSIEYSAKDAYPPQSVSSRMLKVQPQETTRESRTRSDTGEIEVYTIGVNKATKRSNIQCPDSCVPGCMLGGETLYVYMDGDVNTSGVYELREGEWRLLAATDTKHVSNMYLSQEELIIVTNEGNFRVSEGNLVARTGHTYDRCSQDDVTTNVVKTSANRYAIHLDGKKVETIDNPTKCRVHRGGLIYIDDDGHLEGVGSLNEVSAFDSDGSVLAFINASTLGLMFPDSAPRVLSKTHCTMLAISNRVLYCSM